MTRLSHRTAALAGLTALVSSLSFAGGLAPANASEPVASRAATCFHPEAVGAGTGTAAAARGGRSGADHRELSAQERAAIEKAREWLDRIGLTDRADDPAGELPYGAQRRLEIARAMCTDPVLLCLDEPAAGLNPNESAELSRYLRELRDRHETSILLIEHDMSVVMEISDHIVVLDYGVKIADGTPQQIRDNPRVIAAYLGAEEDEVEAIEAELGL